MEKHDFHLVQYQSLRSEIEAIKARLFRTAALGLIIIPGFTYIAELQNSHFVALILPFVVMVVTLIFVAEEHALMRCGRFVREQIEPNVDGGQGWEAWLESQPRLRTMDKCLFGCFVISLFVFYFASSAMATNITTMTYSV